MSKKKCFLANILRGIFTAINFFKHQIKTKEREQFRNILVRSFFSLSFCVSFLIRYCISQTHTRPGDSRWRHSDPVLNLFLEFYLFFSIQFFFALEYFFSVFLLFHKFLILFLSWSCAVFFLVFFNSATIIFFCLHIQTSKKITYNQMSVKQTESNTKNC